jgi:hypothetical protein
MADQDLLRFHKAVRVVGQAPRHDQRTLKMRTYTTSDLPPAPKTFALPGLPTTTPTIYANDRYGCCTKAAWAGLSYSLSMAAGVLPPFNYTDEEVVQMYEQCDGFDPRRPGTDNGSDGLTTLKYLQASGAFGHAPLAYLALDLKSIADYKTASRYFGGTYLGVDLPRAWQGRSTWDVSMLGCLKGKWAPGSWGGHMIYGRPVYTPDYLEILTWQQVYRITWKAVLRYMCEAWAVVALDFKSPDGFDDVRLMQDLHSVKAA